jgi:hypothetical protein
LISEQTLERYRDSLALVIGIMAQRFGSPTGKAESGTEEEFNWALESHLSRGFPEIKWFFREIDEFRAPQDPKAIRDALDQWERVREFQNRLRANEPPVFYCSYKGADEFRRVLEDDLERWLCAPDRPWLQCRPRADQSPAALKAPRVYLENLRQEFWRLDIAGIDNDRAFDIPLSEVYVRLRVMFDSEGAGRAAPPEDDGPIDIRTALLRYSKLAIVGDPGSGKSTFLKFIALTLAQAELESDNGIAIERLSLTGVLPIPIFLSCWDLADFLRKVDAHATLDVLLSFIERRLQVYEFDIARSDLESLLASGGACILFDGLDEVPTDQGRAAVSRLVEQFVARYRQNRYVVTSRVRAYTGDTILKGGFARCDIQPFDADDRATFVRNWMALLFHIAPGQVTVPGSDAALEYQRLTTSIERSDRIRLLAVNPLLLTVIAIVHWNRKRLPEQRVDLYDECVDVLLGQRKDAEHIRVVRLSAALDETLEDERHEDRAWTRKRFGEIALYIQSLAGTSDDAGKSDLVRLLTPRFQDRLGIGEAQAQLRAERFLERHELRSGLLVSHRAQNYRFVHLTFQEYLAAWTLSNMELAEVEDRIGRRLREAKWFETLQLLGGAWAKESDEKLDRYLAWLLEQQGTRIAERAPIVALCANISRDVRDIASMKAETRKRLYESLKSTLHAFKRASGVPALIQVEILEALGTLGAAVKANLIEATQASLYQVRARAIEMLLPHLSEDELFDMTWILQDRSREPVAAYVLALLSRNEQRAIRLFRSAKYRTRAFFRAFSWILSRLHDRFYWKPTRAPMACCASARALTGAGFSTRCCARGVDRRGFQYSVLRARRQPSRRQRRYRRQIARLERIRTTAALDAQLTDAFDGGGGPIAAASSAPVRRIELRVSIPSGPVPVATIRAWLEGLLRHIEPSGGGVRNSQVGLVFHLIKGGRNPQQIARRAREAVERLGAVLVGYPGLRPFIVGLDVAGGERGCPPRLYGEAFAYLRRLQARHRPCADEPPIALGWTYHVGEDCDDLLTGLRHCDEVAAHLLDGGVGRLGHGLALAIDARRFYLRRGGEVEPTLGAHLLDLVWAWGRLVASVDPADAQDALWVKAMIHAALQSRADPSRRPLPPEVTAALQERLFADADARGRVEAILHAVRGQDSIQACWQAMDLEPLARPADAFVDAHQERVMEPVMERVMRGERELLDQLGLAGTRMRGSPWSRTSAGCAWSRACNACCASASPAAASRWR